MQIECHGAGPRNQGLGRNESAHFLALATICRIGAPPPLPYRLNFQLLERSLFPASCLHQVLQLWMHSAWRPPAA